MASMSASVTRGSGIFSAGKSALASTLVAPQVVLTPVVYFRGMARDPLRETVAVNTDNIRDLQAEQAELRKRTHALESTAQGVNLLAKAVDELQESMPNLARRAAREAVAEDRRARHRDWFATARTFAAVLSAGAAIGSLIVYLVLRG